MLADRDVDPDVTPLGADQNRRPGDQGPTGQSGPDGGFSVDHGHRP